MVLGTFQGAIRRYQVTSQAKTDSSGHYEVIGEAGLPYFSGTVLATIPGHAPAWAWPDFPRIEQSFRASAKPKPPQPPPSTQDLVLPDDSGSLRVTVLQDGKPAPGITVAAYLENANLRDVWAHPMGDASAIQNAAYPLTTTNGDGVAIFDCLLPGSYRIVATSEKNAARDRLSGIPWLRGVSNEATGVPVDLGKSSYYRMSIWKQDNRAVLKVLKTDGTQLTTNAAMSYGPVDTIGWNTSPQFDANGLIDLSVSGSGLWRVDVMYRDAPIKSFPIQEPYFRAIGHVASSPNLVATDPPVATARWVDSGSARILMRDLDGKPLRVTVEIMDAFGQENESKVTDEHGEASFSGLRDGTKYFVRLKDSPQTSVQMIAGGKFVTHPAESDFIPEDKTPWLHGWINGWDHVREVHATAAVMERTFIARQDHQTVLEMPVVPMTYVYGQIKVPAGETSSSWHVGVDYSWQRRGVTTTWSDDSGRYVIGPFPPGEVTLNVGSHMESLIHPSIMIAPNEIAPVRFDIDPALYASTVNRQPVSVKEPTESVSLGMGGITSHAGGSARLVGKIYLADGKTPALGAQVLYFPAGVSSPRLIAFADALGALQPRGLWYTGAARPPTDPPNVDTVVAFLPGFSGATVQAVSRSGDEPLRLALPRPASVSGEIKIGGKPFGGRRGVLKVIAAYQGAGFLQPYSNVESTADADGHFVLAGLTQGDYLVQASLDNLWLSQPVPLHVGREFTKPTPMSLAIPSPGVPLRLHLADEGGRPLAGGSVSIEHIGPLSYLWPAHWVADGTGTITVPTLEEGWHVIRVLGEAKPRRVLIPALPKAAVDLAVTSSSTVPTPKQSPDPDLVYNPQ